MIRTPANTVMLGSVIVARIAGQSVYALLSNNLCVELGRDLILSQKWSLSDGIPIGAKELNLEHVLGPLEITEPTRGGI